MKMPDLLLLKGQDVLSLFRRKERVIVDALRTAYLIKEQGDCSVPNCEFLRFPGNSADRIIPKPAFLGGSCQTAGIKWIASFPGNLHRGLERASAILIMNSLETGIPLAIMESSVISAYRTAANATLAASVLRGFKAITTLGILGCGVINFETLRFLLASRPEIKTILLWDVNSVRCSRFQIKATELCRGRHLTVAASADILFEGADVVSVATSALAPHLDGSCFSGSTDVILHTSLRDFMPTAILEADNIVDDIDHVCSNATSLDLTAHREGNRNFIRTTLGAILNGTQPARNGSKPALFSPFGLGILDLAVARLAYDLACNERAGTIIADFLPAPWTDRSE
jgi:2,3-diaminopropionate biosynthesis protein SbnB